MMIQLKTPAIGTSFLALLLLFSLLPSTSVEAQDIPYPISGLWGGTHLDTTYYKGVDIVHHEPPRRDIQRLISNRARMSAKEAAAMASVQTADIVIQFGPGFALLGENEQAAKDAFEFGASIWEMEVVSTVPIIIDADFLDLEGGVLGFNSSEFIFGFEGAPNPSINYATSLANAFAGFDLLPAEPDATQGYNANANFYFGTDGNTPSGQIDFVTVVMHELGHTMGFFGISNGGNGVGQNGGANPSAYDITVELGDGTNILDLGFGTPEQQAALVGDDLFQNAPTAVAALGGQRPKLWAPDPFQPGSSYSHWDEGDFPAGNPNSLMTPFVESGASNFNVGDITRGMLKDMGWSLPTELDSADVGVVALEAPVSSSDLLAGESVQVLIRNFGIEAASGFEVTYILDGGDPVTEVVDFEIPPVSVAQFAFTATVDLDEDGRTYSFEVFTNLVGDQDPSNDGITVEVSNLIPSVDLPVTSLDFGLVGVGNDNTLNIPVVNNGTGPLAGEVVISDLVFSGSAAFSSTEDLSTPVVIEVGQTFEIPVVFTPEMLGVENGSVTFQTNVESFIVDVSLVGEGVDPPIISVDPLEVAVEVEVGEQTSRSISISNSGPAPLSFDLSSVVTTPETENLAASTVPTAVASKRPTALKASGRAASKVAASRSFDNASAAQALASVDADDFVYQLDDGSSENSLGLTTESDILWINAFNTQAGAAVITSIAAVVGEVSAETTATFLLYDDPDNDGDPSNAVLLQSVGGAAITAPGTDTFTTVSIPPTEVSGVFFVGVTVTAPDFPAAIDESSGSQRASWIAGGDPGTIDINDLTNNGLPIALLDDLDFPANFLVRADGQFFAATPLSGTVEPGGSVDLQLDFFPNAPGLFSADLNIENNDPSQSNITVPISMAVEGVSVIAIPDAFDVALPQGDTSTEVLTLQNENNNSEVQFSIAIAPSSSAEDTFNLSSVRRERIPTHPRTAAYSGPISSYTSSQAQLRTDRSNVGIPQYDTGFEEFAPGDINGQLGWFGDFGNWTIEPINPFEGNQHFRGLSDGLGLTASGAPVVGPGVDPISSLTAQVDIQGTGVSWQIAPISVSTELVNTRVFFNPDGSVDVLIDDGTGAVVVPTGANYPEGYFQIDIEVERSTSVFTLSFNGVEVFEGQGFAGDIETFQVLSLMEIAGPTFDLDEVQILDGAAPELGPGFVTPEILAGTIPPGGSVDINLLFDADRAFGRYESDLVVTFNDNPLIPELIVPVALTVEGPPAINVDPTVLQETLNFDEVRTSPLALRNTGGEPVTFDLSIIGNDVGVNVQSSAMALSGEDLSFKKEHMRSPRYLQDLEKSKALIADDQPLEVKVGLPFFTEDFEGAFPPADWTVVDNAGNGVEWVPNTFFSFPNFTGGTGNAATVISDAFPFTEYDTELRTPSINIEGLEALSLEYSVNYQNLENLDFLNVDISTDGGAIWTTMLSWNEDHGGFFDLPGENVSIDLEPFVAGATDIQIRWRYFNPNMDDWDWYVQVDDFQLLANTEVWLAVSPSSGSIPVGETLVLDAVFDASVVDPGQYIAGVIVNSNAVNAPQVGVVAVMTELEPAVIVVEPTAIEKDIIIGDSDFELVRIENQGASDLDFRIEGEFENVGGVPSMTSQVPMELKGPSPIRSGEISRYFSRPAGQSFDLAAVSTTVYATDFEDFVPGLLGFQGGWLSVPSWTITGDAPFAGVQHLQGEATGAGSQVIAFSPTVGIGIEEVSSFSGQFQFELGATWQIVPQSPTAGSVVTLIQVDASGLLSVAAVVDGQGQFVPLFPLEDPYVELGLEVERATGNFVFYVDGFPVFEGTGFTGNIEEVVFVSSDEAPSRLNVDNLRIVDGTLPATPIRVLPREGTIPSGEFLDVFLQLSTVDLPAGVYAETLTVRNSDPVDPIVEVDVTINVLEPPVIEVDPDSISASLPQFSEGSSSLSIANTGQADLTYNIQIQGPAMSLPDTSTSISWSLDPETRQKLRGKPSPPPTTMASSVIDGGVVLLFEEDFDGGTFPPAGWQTVDNAGSGLIWGLSSTQRGPNFTGGSGEAASADSDWFGPAPYDTELITPVISAEDKTGLVLEYLANFQPLDGDRFDADISVDGGVTWTNMLSWDAPTGGFLASPGVQVSLPLDPFIGGAAGFQVRWRYYSPNPNDPWDWYAQVDNVKVGTSWVSVDPAAGVVDGGQQAPVDVLFNTQELEVGSYAVDLVINSSDRDRPEVIVPVSLEVTEDDRQRVFGFTLIDSRSDEDLREIVDGDVINLFAEGVDRINIRADVSPEEVGSVKLELRGRSRRNQTENFAPYALFGDSPRGNYRNWKPKLGSYTLTATPFSESRGRGEAGVPLTISFDIVEENNATIAFSLVDAVADEVVGALADGAVLNLADLGLSDGISIQANTDPETVGSVEMILSGAESHRQTENFTPYALFGDSPRGDFNAWKPAPGEYSLTARAYTKSRRRGSVSADFTLNFTIEGESSSVQTLTEKARIAGASWTPLLVPNPIDNHFELRFPKALTGDVQVTIMNGAGTVLYKRNASLQEVKNARFDLDRGLRPGVYFLRVESPESLDMFQLIKR